MMRNPVFESSMTRRMRSYRAPLLLTLYGVFVALVTIGELVILQQDTLYLTDLRVGLQTYIFLSIMQFALIVLVGPALTAGAIAGERERQTLDLLLCTRVGALRIVLGKLLSSVCFLALMVVISLPLMAVALFFGGIRFMDMLVMALFLIVTALACCAVGIFCSALLRRTVTATVVAYLIVFALGIGTILFPLMFQRSLLNSMEEVLMSTSSYSNMGSVAISVIGSSGAAPSSAYLGSAIAATPKALLINPAVGLFSLLVEQTGMLQQALQGFFGYRGTSLFSYLDIFKSMAYINIALLLVCSAVLTGLATLFIRPSQRKERNK